MRNDFLELKKYYKEAATIIPNNSFFKNFIDRKFKHSIKVLHLGKRIMHETNELKTSSQLFADLAQKALLFHDVGRFEEAILRFNSTNASLESKNSNQYDHGLIGYNKLKNNHLYNDIRILIPILFHGKMIDEVKKSSEWKKISRSPYKNETKQILYLVRDADKLENLEKIKKEDKLRKDLLFRSLSQEAIYAGLSESVKQQFFAKQTISLSTIHSFADRILLVISWIFDLNYQKTKEIFKQEEYDKHLLNMLSEYHNSHDDIAEIAKFINENL